MISEIAVYFKKGGMKARISQEIIAKKIGVSRRTYNAIEIGNRDMPWTTFLKQNKFSRK